MTDMDSSTGKEVPPRRFYQLHPGFAAWEHDGEVDAKGVSTLTLCGHTYEIVLEELASVAHRLPANWYWANVWPRFAENPLGTRFKALEYDSKVEEGMGAATSLIHQGRRYAVRKVNGVFAHNLTNICAWRLTVVLGVQQDDDLRPAIASTLASADIEYPELPAYALLMERFQGSVFLLCRDHEVCVAAHLFLPTTTALSIEEDLKARRVARVETHDEASQHINSW